MTKYVHHNRPLLGLRADMRRPYELARTVEAYTHVTNTCNTKGLRAPKGYARVLWVTARPIGRAEASAVTVGALCTTREGARYYHARKRDGLAQVGRRVDCGARHIKLATLETVVGVGRADGYDIRLVSCGSFEPAEAVNTPTSARTRAVCASARGTRKATAAKPNRDRALPEMFIAPQRF